MSHQVLACGIFDVQSAMKQLQNKRSSTYEKAKHGPMASYSYAWVPRKQSYWETKSTDRKWRNRLLKLLRSSLFIVYRSVIN